MDHEVMDRNTRLYYTRRGRRCPGCGCKVRYTRSQHYCESCEKKLNGVEIPKHGQRNIKKPGPKSRPLPRLRELRLQRFAYAVDFARAAGMDASHVRRIERGQRATDATARKLADALGVNVEDLL